MKINEIIVESRTQLDEGLIDTIKSKLSGLYQMAKKKYPNFDEAFTIAKSHKSEINDIIEQLKAKKESGKLSKEDVVAAIMPLSKKIAGDSGINEGKYDNMLIASFLSAPASIFVWVVSNLGTERIGFMSTLFICVAIGAALGAMRDSHDASPGEVKKRDAEAARIEKEKEYWAVLNTDGTRTAQERDDWNTLWDKYGEGRYATTMSHVEIEKYYNKAKSDAYRASEANRQQIRAQLNSDPNDEIKQLKRKLTTGRGTARDRTRYDELYNQINSKGNTNNSNSTNASNKNLEAEFANIKRKMSTGTGTRSDRERYDELYLKGYR